MRKVRQSANPDEVLYYLKDKFAVPVRYVVKDYTQYGRYVFELGHLKVEICDLSDNPKTPCWIYSIASGSKVLTRSQRFDNYHEALPDLLKDLGHHLRVSISELKEKHARICLLESLLVNPGE